MFNKKVISCEGCFKEFGKSEVQVVSTFRRGYMNLCKSCAKKDRDDAKESLKEQE